MLATVSPSHADGGVGGRLVVEQLVGPLRVLRRGPAAAAEKAPMPRSGFSKDQLQVIAGGDLGGGLLASLIPVSISTSVSGADPVDRPREPQRQAPSRAG